jgi:hypothetical protein
MKERPVFPGHEEALVVLEKAKADLEALGYTVSFNAEIQRRQYFTSLADVADQNYGSFNATLELAKSDKPIEL